MKMSKVGNQTNSQDPQAVNSRVFVGNLNTFQCSKTDVERMFQRYGRLAGISMHKGYAFVQFTNPFDARSACLGEDGRTVLSQILDVNMVAEPKPHQTGRKRQNVAKTGNDWDYYYDSYYASTAGFPVGPPPRLVPPLKRPRLMPLPGRPAKVAATAQNNPKSIVPPLLLTVQPAVVAAAAATTPSIHPTAFLDQLKTYSNPDILICGNCREMFTELKDLIEHKRTYCKLRFTCKCHSFNPSPPSDETTGLRAPETSSVSLLCVQCKDSFPNAWDLMVHAQAAHMVNIYELGLPKLDAKSDVTESSEPPSPRESTPEKEDKKNGLSLENGSGGEYGENGVASLLMVDSPADSSSQHGDKTLENLLDVQSSAQACIMHALSIGSIADEGCSPRPGEVPTPLAVALTNGKQ